MIWVTPNYKIRLVQSHNATQERLGVKRQILHVPNQIHELLRIINVCDCVESVSSQCNFLSYWSHFVPEFCLSAYFSQIGLIMQIIV